MENENKRPCIYIEKIYSERERSRERERQRESVCVLKRLSLQVGIL